MKVCQIFTVLFLIFTANFAFAQGASPGYIVDEISDNVSVWQTNMEPAIRKLFFLLIGLDFAWMAVRLTLKQGVLEEWVSTIVRKIIFYGFGLALLQFGADWAKFIVGSFFQLAGIAGGNPNMGIFGIWNLGIETVTAMYENLSFWDGVGFSLFLGLAILAVIALSAYISAVLVLAYAETYIVLGAGTVILGLSGSEWTKGYSEKYLHFAIMSGMKLFITLLIGQLGMVLIGNWVTALKGGDLADIAMGLGSFLVFTVLIGKLPSTITGMMSGAGIQGSEGVVSSSLKMAGMAAATAATGGAAAVATAAKLSKAEGATGIGGMAGGTVKNLAQSFSDDLKGAFGSKKTGIDSQPSMGHRMSARMEGKIDEAKAKQESKSNSITAGSDSGTKGSAGSNQSNKENDSNASPGANGGTNETGDNTAGQSDSANAVDETGDNMAGQSDSANAVDETGDNMAGQSDSANAVDETADNMAGDFRDAGQALEAGQASAEQRGEQAQVSGQDGSSTMGSSPAPQSSPQGSQVSNAGAPVGSAPVGSMSGQGGGSSMGSSPAPQSSPQGSQVSNAGAPVGSAPVGSMSSSQTPVSNTNNTVSKFDETADNMQQSQMSKLDQMRAKVVARKTVDFRPQNSKTDFT